MAVKSGNIFFHYPEWGFELRTRSTLKAFLLSMTRKEGKKVDTINYIFCNDAYLLMINQEYLGHDYYTDIITFELSESGDALVADIFISIDRVRDNSVAFKVSFKRELLRVIIHGMLHLCGYSDKSKAQKQKMRDMEDVYLNKFLRST
ncbi:MAG TPA: rRNA maturation RNase YbeY [Chitinophagaceae bacterium]